MINKERIYKYRQLLDGINNSIVASITTGKKYQILENFNIVQIYMAMAKGAWLEIQPMINSECTEEEEDELWFYWNSITSYDCALEYLEKIE